MSAEHARATPRVSDERLEELRRRAQAATPGPWRPHWRYKGGDGGTLIAAFAPGHRVVTDIAGGTMPSADMEHVAANSPDRVLELLDDLRDARAENERLRAERDELKRPGCKCRATHGSGFGEPQDCDWAYCGCDPQADRVMAGLQECGWQGPDSIREIEQERDKALAAARRLKETLKEVKQWERHIEHEAACSIGPGRCCDCNRFPLMVHIVDALAEAAWLAAPEPQEPPAPPEGAQE